MNKARQHREICEQLTDIYNKKNADYGDSFSKSFESWGMAMPCIRIEDKVNRLNNLVKTKDQQVNDEGIEDTLLDLANYTIMTIMELRKENPSDISKKTEDILQGHASIVEIYNSHNDV